MEIYRRRTFTQVSEKELQKILNPKSWELYSQLRLKVKPQDLALKKGVQKVRSQPHSSGLIPNRQIRAMLSEYVPF